MSYTVCLKGQRDVFGPSLERAPEWYLYIGRQMYMGGWKLSQSKWANPFSVKQYGRKGALEKYREYILSTPELFNALSELSGKTLLCWCAPEPCHGDILVELYLKYLA